MKKIIVLIIALVFLTSCATFKNMNFRKDTKPQPIEFRGLQCAGLQPGRGLGIDFIEDAPPKELTMGKRFPISLKFANYHKDPLFIDLLVQDDSGTATFPPQKLQMTVEPAAYERNRLVSPGCSVGEDLPEKNLGMFSYNLDANKEIRFIAKAKFDYVSTISASVCAFNPIIGSAASCAKKETLQGPEALGPGTQYDPVAITRIDKNLVGIDRNQVVMSLDIYMKNLVKNSIIATQEREKVKFSITSDEVSFQCRVANTEETGATLDVPLDENSEAVVSCESTLSLDRTERYSLKIELRYPYEYFIVSNPIKYTANPKS